MWKYLHLEAKKMLLSITTNLFYASSNLYPIVLGKSLRRKWHQEIMCHNNLQ